MGEMTQEKHVDDTKTRSVNYLQPDHTTKKIPKSVATGYISPAIPETSAVNQAQKDVQIEVVQYNQTTRAIRNYASRNNPASLRHFTLVLPGNKSWNSSQCKIEARPPAEHPERRA